MDRTPVTVAQFAAFVNNNGYKTDAERYGSGGVLDERKGAWIAIDDPNWRHPQGPERPPGSTQSSGDAGELVGRQRVLPSRWRASADRALRGGKLSHYEGGVRVPFMLRWPGHVKAGIVYREVVSLLDVLPTSVAAAGGPRL